MVIDLGEQWSEAFQKTNHKVMITWEVTDESTTIDGEESESDQQGIYSFPFPESNLKEPPGGLERKEVYRSEIRQKYNKVSFCRYGEYPFL